MRGCWRIVRKSRIELARHELYAARFYWDKEKYTATVLRTQRVLDDFAGLGLEPEALLLMARAQVQLDQLDAARKTLTQLVDDHSDSPEAAEGRQLLADMERIVPEPE